VPGADKRAVGHSKAQVDWKGKKKKLFLDQKARERTLLSAVSGHAQASRGAGNKSFSHDNECR